MTLSRLELRWYVAAYVAALCALAFAIAGFR